MRPRILENEFTGSCDLANTLAKQGRPTVQYTSVQNHAAADDVEAGHVDAKTVLEGAAAICRKLSSEAAPGKFGSKDYLARAARIFAGQPT